VLYFMARNRTGEVPRFPSSRDKSGAVQANRPEASAEKVSWVD
jgi:hypothetical protein